MKRSFQEKAFCAACRAILFLAIAAPVYAQSGYFRDWPEGSDPRAFGDRIAQHFANSPPPNAVVTYQEVCAWYGSLSYADTKDNTDLRSRLQARLQLLLTAKDKHQIPDKEHVDFEIFGIVPLWIFIQNKDASLERLGLRFADRQWSDPQPDGLSGESRLWIDDMYMITILQGEAYRTTGDSKYIDRAARELVFYLRKLQQPNRLFFHATDVPFYWGRGNGWVAVGIAELLATLPMDCPDRAEILAGFRKMMKELVKYQGADGMWRQLIDHPESLAESSSTGMFTFAIVEGVRRGWLEETTYGLAARRGWIALAGYVGQNADLTYVCAGTNNQSDCAYYMARPRRTGDFHGQAPAMWAARALLEK